MDTSESWLQLDQALKELGDKMSRASAEKFEKKNLKSAAEKRFHRQAEIANVWRKYWSNLWGTLYNDDSLPTSITIRVNDRGFLAIINRGGPGSREVAFGSGADWIEALDELNATLSRDNWKDSKYQD